MRVKVIESFIDKTTNEVRALDEVFECSDERFQEITKAGNYVVAEPDKKHKE